MSDPALKQHISKWQSHMLSARKTLIQRTWLQFSQRKSVQIASRQVNRILELLIWQIIGWWCLVNSLSDVTYGKVVGWWQSKVHCNFFMACPLLHLWSTGAETVLMTFPCFLPPFFCQNCSFVDKHLEYHCVIRLCAYLQCSLGERLIRRLLDVCTHGLEHKASLFLARRMSGCRVVGMNPKGSSKLFSTARGTKALGKEHHFSPLPILNLLCSFLLSMSSW